MSNGSGVSRRVFLSGECCAMNSLRCESRPANPPRAPSSRACPHRLEGPTAVGYQYGLAGRDEDLHLLALA